MSSPKESWSAAGFTVERGKPLPFGATDTGRGLNFSLFSKHATSACLVLLRPETDEAAIEVPLDPLMNRTGHIWHILVQDLRASIYFGWRLAGPRDEKNLHRFSPEAILIDPYARGLAGGAVWGESGISQITGPEGEMISHQRLGCLEPEEFDWEGDVPPRTPLGETVIYELHARGYTAHPSSGASRPGTYLGLTEKIPYLKELGITAVELMPVFEFDENEHRRRHPRTGELLRNLWGYSPIAFFAPKASYASDGHRCRQVNEFREMVRAFHRAGLEVILDVVFNHTGEGNERGPTLSFRGIDNCIYYMLDENGRYRNFSGCGNTLNCNHPHVRSMILDCLRYWVSEMHIDGFRFDLASVLGRGEKGEILAKPPLLEHIAADPVLADTKIIAEAWDAAGLYQVGSFPVWGRWAEWNGLYRDQVRAFWKGGKGLVSRLADRICGSEDLYVKVGSWPYHSINFITAHDGFTLNDLVSYERKHNEDNGEDNRDGENNNNSINFGVEGPTGDPHIIWLRKKQMKNLLATLLLSQGVPMLLAGDEFCRTQNGNNNAYCQDNEVSWVNWDLAGANADMLRFTRLMIAFRKRHHNLRRRHFFRHGAGISWHGERAGRPDWSAEARWLAFLLEGRSAPERPADQEIFVMLNASERDRCFEIPRIGKEWLRVIDTAKTSPEDICEHEEKAVPLGQHAGHYRVQAKSMVVLVAR